MDPQFISAALPNFTDEEARLLGTVLTTSETIELAKRLRRVTLTYMKELSMASSSDINAKVAKADVSTPVSAVVDSGRASVNKHIVYVYLRENSYKRNYYAVSFQGEDVKEVFYHGNKPKSAGTPSDINHLRRSLFEIPSESVVVFAGVPDFVELLIKFITDVPAGPVLKPFEEIVNPHGLFPKGIVPYRVSSILPSLSDSE